jgi:hypothetical protein
VDIATSAPGWGGMSAGWVPLKMRHDWHPPAQKRLQRHRW